MAAALFLRQIWALTWKDLLLTLNRKQAASTIFRAFTVPLVFVMYMSFIIRVYWPKETYGIGTSTPIRSLPDALNGAGEGRHTLALCNYGPRDGDIDKVIAAIAASARTTGKPVELLYNPDDLLTVCRSALSGNTKCFGAAEFYTSPKEGGAWNYTLRNDGAFGISINVKKNNNDAETYPIPLQHAIDAVIASVEFGEDTTSLPKTVEEYPFTSKTQKQWDDSITTSIQNANTKYIGIVWYLGFVGLCYQLVGIVAGEREQGMADLLESMMPNTARWQPQVARLLGHHIAFTIIYFPSWILMAIIAKVGLFPKISLGILIIFNILAGLSLNSFSILGASIKRSQLSGITAIVVALVLGIVAQITAETLSTAAVTILSIIFTPMKYVFFFIFMARYEHKQIPANLVEAAPGATWRVPGIAFWIMMIVQIFVYPVLGASVERYLYSTASKRGRTVTYDDTTHPFYRVVAPLLGFEKTPVVAVKSLSLTALPGHILVLVGANGCGKPTTLNAIAGLNDVTSGAIDLDGTGGIGICPQKNVLWESLTVEQHTKIFYRIKSTTISPASDGELSQLIYDCGLTKKIKAYAGTLSGGQKRKLQLIMMLTGGSKVCCVDEVSGGLDPLSRRKVWDILLAARGTRTVLLTTHFLDEVKYLADHMVIMSKGELKAEGSVSELKNKLGDGYRVRILHGTGYGPPPEVGDLLNGVPKEVLCDQTIYTISDTNRAMNVIKEFESRKIANYQVTGPTMEEVFMKLAEDPDSEKNLELADSNSEPAITPSPSHQKEKGRLTITQEEVGEPLMSGQRLGFVQQAIILFRKRMVILRRNYLPYIAAFIIPIIATALVTILVRKNHLPGCSPRQQVNDQDIETLSTENNYKPLLVLGPTNAFLNANLTKFRDILPKQFGNANTSQAALLDHVHLVDSLDEFNSYIRQSFHNVTPGGFFLGGNGSIPTFSYYSDIGTLGVYSSVFLQNAFDVMSTNISIVTNYRSFNYPWPDNAGNSIQFIFYFGLIMAAYPAFFTLYPTVERLHKIRALEYSNGVRSLPLWLAYLSFDWANTLLVSVFITAIMTAAANDAWWNLPYLFIVLFLYGFASVLWSYVVSLWARSQLSAFAISAGSQAFMLLMYLTAIFNIQTRLDPTKVDDATTIVNFTFNLVTPIGNLARALILSLNMFSSLCSGAPSKMATFPGSIKLYGGPILYLVGQSLFQFGVLMLVDHGWTLNWFKKPAPESDVEDHDTKEKEVCDEIERVASSNDGLRVLHLTKTFKTRAFGTVTAVDDLSFGVKKGEMFAIVGPNGAGKSTTITMLRGELQPSRKGGEIYIEGVDVRKERKTARSHLGMTVLEHLEFYAGIRGVKEAKRNARQIVKAVGLQVFAHMMASKLSGGNKRKLSLGIALIGNPEVVLLDEPSSGMDPLAKRTMWKTLTSFVPNRSILLTTHSMEEAGHLADRVGVLAKRMLDIGSTAHLRTKHGHGFHIHLIASTAPHTSAAEMERVCVWIEQQLPGAKAEGLPYHGQMRFSIPASSGLGKAQDLDQDLEKSLKASSLLAPPPEDLDLEITQSEPGLGGAGVSIGALFVLLEENKEKLGLEFYSVSPSTIDEVFLRAVEKHNVGEEDRPEAKKDWRFYARQLMKMVYWV
ncbi:putative ABC transporter [Mytilinidion resinicola]|uniref:ABC transporter n=1 Tax=Mytilinidion resinicola TaxID=574789 RepID=A0A6A6YIB2_9PEZI|nr:putative ABC transporter [Mytilinidion resinicola]KAF2808309.1 putative ABC transporter [Mytilinidion resinicola]